MLALYNILLILLAPLWVPWMMYRAAKRKKPVDWDERTGRLRIKLKDGTTRVWIHAVSVGEVIATTPIIRGLRDEIPDAEIVLSVTTSSGYETATGLPPGTVDHVVYLPIDIPRFVLASLAHVRPKAIVIMETELWLNLVDMAERMGIPTIIVNGRISDRHFPRMKRIRPYYQAVFNRLSKIYTQSDTDRARFLEFGAKEAETIGNCKFDQVTVTEPVDVPALKSELGIPPENLVVVVGSTRSELEEELVISALERLEFDNLSVIHAPRHIERADAIAEKATASFGVAARRSRSENGKYLILDTYGELNRVYACADIVIVGGAFDKLGGQNLIQPLALGKPVLHGANMNNFRDVADLSVKAGASIICESADDLLETLNFLAKNPPERLKMGEAASKLVKSQQGSSLKYAQLIRNVLKSSERRANSDQ